MIAEARWFKAHHTRRRHEDRRSRSVCVHPALCPTGDRGLSTRSGPVSASHLTELRRSSPRRCCTALPRSRP